jgi:hypothetical protein
VQVDTRCRERSRICVAVGANGDRPREKDDVSLIEQPAPGDPGHCSLGRTEQTDLR